MTDTHGTQTMVRTQVAVNDSGFFLAPDQDVGDIEARIEAALRAGGGFVRFSVVGDRTMSVLITQTSRVVFTIETVRVDGWETADHSTSFGGGLDLF